MIFYVGHPPLGLMVPGGFDRENKYLEKVAIVVVNPVTIVA
jgi:hypothetical protein